MADTVDASIPLGYKFPEALTPQGQAALQQLQYKNQLTQLQVADAQQQAQQKNAMLDILRQPGAVGDNGLPTQETIGKITTINPEAGITLQNNLARYEQQRQAALTNQIHQRLLGLQVNDNQTDRLQEIATNAQVRYDDLVASGTPAAEATKIVSKERNDAVNQAQQDGTLLPQQAQRFQGPFNPDMNRAFVAAAPGYKRVLDERRQQSALQVQQDREVRLENNDNTRTEAAQETPFMKEAAATYGKDTPEYKKAVADHVAKETAPGGAKGTPFGAREAVYVNRALSSAGLAMRDISNIARGPTTSSSGIFGGSTAGPSLLDAPKNVLANTVTSQEAQTYNVKIAGLQRNLATLESQGLAPSGSLTHQMDAIVFKEGDTNLTKAYKLAETRQIVEGAMDVIQSNDRAPQSAKDLATKIVNQTKQAVPFTVEDIDNLQASKNPKATLKDFVKKQEASSGGGKEKAPQAAIDYLKAHPEAKDQFKAKYGYLP
jgi:hypothetical protein